MRRLALALPLAFAVLAWLACGAAPAGTEPETGFLERSVVVDGVDYRYHVFVPDGFDPASEATWPVVLFLHGAGERGSDGARQTTRGLPARLRRRPDFPAVVVMPQCRRGAWWGEPAMEAQVFRALERTMQEFRGDPERVYLTGLSMGGYAAWAFGYKYPDTFAALVPVCGGVGERRGFPAPSWHPAARNPSDPYAETASRVRNLPVWAFHGDADPVVPVSESRKLIEALRAEGGANDVRYTEYPGVGHDSWDRAYAEEELYEWLFSKSRGASEP